MKKLNFYNKKGFTLVECIVAIAVFAVMTSMVMIIISSAINTTRQAVNGERDLNQMVEAVENDQSIKNYNSLSSHTLVMKFGEDTDNFSITYDTSDGYMSYMTCHWCKYIGPRHEFLRRIADSSTYKKSDQALKDKYPYTYWFDPIQSGISDEFGTYSVPGVTIDPADKSDDTRYDYGTEKQKTYVTYLRKYCCPKCGGLIQPADVQPLQCLDCDYECNPQNTAENNTDPDVKNRKGFHWDHETSTYYCNKCGSSRVIEKGMKDLFGSGAQFEIGGMFPNAIRYGIVDQPDDDAVKSLVGAKAVSGGSELTGFKMTLNTTVYSSVIPATHKISISELSAKANVTIELPAGYIIPKVEKRKTDGTIYYEYNINRTNSSDKSNQPVWTLKNGKDSSEGSTITIPNVSSGAGVYTLAFTLVNEKSGSSFETDYADEGGLAGYWFRMLSGTDTVKMPRDKDNIKGYTKSS